MRLSLHTGVVRQVLWTCGEQAYGSLQMRSAPAGLDASEAGRCVEYREVGLTDLGKAFSDGRHNQTFHRGDCRRQQSRHC